MVLVLQTWVLVMGPRLKSSRCHTSWLKHRWPRPSPSLGEVCASCPLAGILRVVVFALSFSLIIFLPFFFFCWAFSQHSRATTGYFHGASRWSKISRVKAWSKYHWFEQYGLNPCTPHHTQLVILFRCRHGYRGSGVLSMNSPSPIMHKLINSFTLAIFYGTCASKMSFGHGPKVKIFAAPYLWTQT